MANPSSKWDFVPVWGVYLRIDNLPSAGTVQFTLAQRITRVDGRLIYPDGAAVSAIIGNTSQQDATVRAAVRAAWRATDETAAGVDFDGAAWDVWWDTIIVPAAIFTSFPASDDPDIVQRGYSVTVKEQLQSGGGKQFAIAPVTEHLDLPIPGINLGLIEVPPGSSVPAPMYAKGVPGGVAALNLAGQVVNAAGEVITPGGGGVSSWDDLEDKPAVIAAGATEAAARAAIGAGTSNLALGPAGHMAAAGDHTHTPASIGAATAAQGAKADTAVQAAQLGVASGVATLDSGGKLAAAQVPDLAVADYLGAVASQAEMLALNGQRGDWCTRTDTSMTWIITGANPTVIGSWTQMAAPVSSVAGRTGAVTLSGADVGLGSVDNTPDNAKSFAGSQVAAATDTARGTVELATTVEAAAGTDTARAVTPAGLGATIGPVATRIASTPYVLYWDATLRQFDPIPTPRPAEVLTFNATKDPTFDPETELPDLTTHPLLEQGDIVEFYYEAS